MTLSKGCAVFAHWPWKNSKTARGRPNNSFYHPTFDILLQVFVIFSHNFVILFHELCFFRGILELNYSHSCLWVQAINHTMTLKTTRSPACLMKQYKFYSQSDLGTFNFLHCLSRIFSFGIKNIIKYYRSSPRPGLTALFAYRLCSTII